MRFLTLLLDRRLALPGRLGAADGANASPETDGSEPSLAPPARSRTALHVASLACSAAIRRARRVSERVDGASPPSEGGDNGGEGGGCETPAGTSTAPEAGSVLRVGRGGGRMSLSLDRTKRAPEPGEEEEEAPRESAPRTCRETALASQSMLPSTSSSSRVRSSSAMFGLSGSCGGIRTEGCCVLAVDAAVGPMGPAVLGRLNAREGGAAVSMAPIDMRPCTKLGRRTGEADCAALDPGPSGAVCGRRRRLSSAADAGPTVASATEPATEPSTEPCLDCSMSLIVPSSSALRASRSSVGEGGPSAASSAVARGEGCGESEASRTTGSASAGGGAPSGIVVESAVARDEREATELRR